MIKNGIAVVLLIVGIAVLAYSTGQLDERKAQIKNIGVLKEQIASMKKPVKINTETQAVWVVSHSSRISYTTAKLIAEEASKYLHSTLILSLIEAESEFTPTAVSKVGAVGLGQIMYDIHKKDMASLGICKKRDLFDIDKNIKATSFVLQMMLKKNNGDVVKALHSYLGGKDGKYTSRILSNYVHLSLEIENDLSNM